MRDTMRLVQKLHPVLPSVPPMHPCTILCPGSVWCSGRGLAREARLWEWLPSLFFYLSSSCFPCIANIQNPSALLFLPLPRKSEAQFEFSLRSCNDDRDYRRFQRVERVQWSHVMHRWPELGSQGLGVGLWRRATRRVVGAGPLMCRQTRDLFAELGQLGDTLK